MRLEPQQRPRRRRLAWSLACIAVLLEAASMLVGVIWGQPSDSLAEGVGNVVVIAAALAGVLAEMEPLDSLLAAGWSGLPDFIGDVSGLALPLSVGIAVTRYRPTRSTG